MSFAIHSIAINSRGARGARAFNEDDGGGEYLRITEINTRDKLDEWSGRQGRDRAMRV
jgi:hypothetical protein